MMAESTNLPKPGERWQIKAEDAAGIVYWLEYECTEYGGMELIREIVAATTALEPKQETWRDRPPML